MTYPGDAWAASGSVLAAPAASPPTGWYPDPTGSWRWRHWDGAAWTQWVSDGQRVVSEELPGPDVRMQLPVRAIWWGIGGIVFGAILGNALALLADWLSNDRLVVELIVGQFGLWTGFVGAVVIASRRYGTGRVFADYGVMTKKHDIWRGLGFSFLARIGAVVVIIPVVLIFNDYFKHAPDGGGALDFDPQDRGALITLALIAAVGAPFIEELLFRGLIMGSLRQLGAFRSIAIQGVLFGAVHMQVVQGRSNILTFLAIGSAGMFLGWCAHHYKRLGVGMWTHCFFNLLVVGILVGTSF